MTAGPSSRTRSAVTKFIAGEPMNPATNKLTGASNRAWGVSACCSRPSRSTATRFPRVIASTWSWVTYTVVTPSRSCSWFSEARIETRSLASRLLNGSSIKNACGSRTMARPIATRCRCPPDSAAGLRRRYGSRPSILAAPVTRRRISSFGVLRSCSPNARFCSTVMCGYRA